MPHTNFPEKIRRRSICAMDVPIISRAAGTVMFPSRVIGVVTIFGSPLISNITINVDRKQAIMAGLTSIFQSSFSPPGPPCIIFFPSEKAKRVNGMFSRLA